MTKTLKLIFLSLFLIQCQNPDNKNNQLNSSNELQNNGLKNIASFPMQVLKDEKLKKIVLDNFNSLTATNDMKMYSIGYAPDSYNWARADSLVAFCERNDLRIFGHALVWHFGMPQWITSRAEERGKEWVDSFFKEYITEVVSRYKGKIAAWDVVNEGLETKGGALRKTLWYETMGPEYIEKAFAYAHEADPDALLFYNDFNTERDTAKLHGMLKIADNLIEKNIPIHGLGFQMHIRIDTDEDLIAYAFQKAAETGLKIHISELDIIFNKHDDTQGGGQQIYHELTTEMLDLQARKYRAVVDLYKKYIPADQRYGITFWDFTDRDTWVNGFFNIKDWPTIFDENLEPKPAYYEFAKGLKNDQP